MKTKFRTIGLISTSALLMAVPVVSLSCSNNDGSTRNTFDIGTDASFAPYNFAITSSQYNKISSEARLEQDNPATPELTPTTAREFMKAIAPVDSGNGYVGGYDIFIANTVAEELGESTMAHIIPFPQLIPMMRTTNNLDAIAADMSITPSRQEEINFSLPYNKPKNVIMYNKNNMSDFDVVNGVPVATTNRTTIASRTNTTWSEIASKIPHQGDVIEMETTELLENRMINPTPGDSIDGILFEESRAKLVASRYPNRIGYFGADNFAYQTQPDDLIALGLPKNQYSASVEGVARRRQINSSIANMSSEDWETNMELCIELAKFVGAA